MKKTLGILLIMMGAGMLSFQGCNHNGGIAPTENAMIQGAPKQQSSVNWLPFLGAAIFISGVILTTRRK